MKTLFAAVPFIVLAACARESVDPTGVYRLTTAERAMTLEVRPSGDYVLQINGTERNPDQLRGRWEKGSGSGPDIALHGIAWHGSEPEGGNAVWTVTFQGNADICLDAEGQTCFTKVDGA